MFSFNILTNIVFYWLAKESGQKHLHFFTLYCLTVGAQHVIGYFGSLDTLSFFWAHVVEQEDRVLFPCWNHMKPSQPRQFHSAWPKHLGCRSHAFGRCFWLRTMAWASDCWMPCIWHSTFHVNSRENREGLHDCTFTNREILVSKYPPHG